MHVVGKLHTTGKSLSSSMERQAGEGTLDPKSVNESCLTKQMWRCNIVVDKSVRNNEDPTVARKQKKSSMKISR